jgi:hypothetical protein
VSNAVTSIRVIAETDDPLESVRKAVAFADAMVAEGATVSVTGDLAFSIRFEVPKPEPEKEPAS